MFSRACRQFHVFRRLAVTPPIALFPALGTGCPFLLQELIGFCFSLYCFKWLNVITFVLVGFGLIVDRFSKRMPHVCFFRSSVLGDFYRELFVN